MLSAGAPPGAASCESGTGTDCFPVPEVNRLPALPGARTLFTHSNSFLLRSKRPLLRWVRALFLTGYTEYPLRAASTAWSFSLGMLPVTQIHEAAGALEDASQALNAAEASKGPAKVDKELSRKIFWRGFAFAIGSVLVILSLWTFLIKQGM